jgi:hypothetical protein
LWISVNDQSSSKPHPQSLFYSFSKKITSRSAPNANAMLINAVSIDHLQNHFLPGSIGITYDMHYYIKPSTTQPDCTTVTQVACVDYGFVIFLFWSFKKILFLVVDQHNGMKMYMVHY